MKLFTTKQIAELDRFTIENEPIFDIDLMERAATEVSGWLANRYSTGNKMVFFAGPGNNGGDALAIARQLANLDFLCEVYLLKSGKSLQGSPLINLERLLGQKKVRLFEIIDIPDFPLLQTEDIVIDGLFGSGLTRQLDGLAKAIVQKINASPNTVISIDIPSGLPGEGSTGCNETNTIQACHTLTFEFPKLSLLFPENEKFTGRWEVLPIRLHPDGITKTQSNFHFIEENDVRQIIKPRSKFAHKGNFGHALLISGSYGKMGAAVLASKACLRAGTGLLTTHVPTSGYSIIQIAVPEAMASIDKNSHFFSEAPETEAYSAIGTGPGIGTSHETQKALYDLFKNNNAPMVIDADALNILAMNPGWLIFLPENTILTPHPGEFKRLAGDSDNSWERLEKQVHFSIQNKVIVILKGAYTSISLPDGKVYFNSTGNPGMATAGSGDVLTGIILGFLSQGISPENASIAAVYLHGMAGDLAAADLSEPALMASDINEFLGEAFKKLNPSLEK